MRGFTTTLIWEAKGVEWILPVRVTYTATKGYPATMEEPSSDGELEILSITPSYAGGNVLQHFYEDDDLIAECWGDWQAEQEDARAYRAEARRDDRMMEGWA